METARLLRAGSSHHTCTSFRSSFTGANVLRAAPCRVATPSRKCNVQEIRAAVIAEPAKLDVKTFQGSSVGSENLALKVAESGVAKGLVHRYVVLIRQNGRAVCPPIYPLVMQYTSVSILPYFDLGLFFTRGGCLANTLGQGLFLTGSLGS
jgi:hypothetical protein